MILLSSPKFKRIKYSIKQCNIFQGYPFFPSVKEIKQRLLWKENILTYLNDGTGKKYSSKNQTGKIVLSSW